MRRQKAEKNHFDMANRIYAQTKSTQAELFRMFRVYHPVYEISVDIETEQVEDNYHIIEKYMDKLVCGYIGEHKSLGDGIFVKDKDELFELLGIDQQAYEIAERFYQDLIRDGHFKEIPNVGIQGLRAAKESIKLEKRMNATMVKQRKLFDQFSGKLMPGQFYEFQKYACKNATLNEDSPLVKNSVWLEPNLTVLKSDADIEQMIGNYEYVNAERIDRGLPQGFQGMSIAKEEAEPIEMAFYPYYLAILKEGEEFSYAAFRIDNGQPLAWIGQQYQTMYYKGVVDLFRTLADVTEKDVKNPLYMEFNLTVGGEPDETHGVSREETTGNYIWNIQDWQLKVLLGLDENQKCKRLICRMIAQNEITCLTSYEAGKIVCIVKSDKQKKLLTDALDASTVEEREELFKTYLKETGRSTHVAKPGDEQRVLTEEDRKKIEEAKQLYAQERYAEAMETLEEYGPVDARCAFDLGYMYGNGCGVERDDEKACEWYKISLRLGNGYAGVNLGRRYQNASGVPKDEKKAVEVFHRAAELGEAEGMYLLACCYDNATGTEKNEVEALRWYRKAIEAGRTKDYFDIAYLLGCGSEVVRDYKEAARYYELSIQEGCGVACNNMGVLYANGQGVEQNWDKAIEYYKMGVSRGSAMAMKNLATQYESGKYIERDLKKALALYEQAAAKGNKLAKDRIEGVKQLIAAEEQAGQTE